MHFHISFSLASIFIAIALRIWTRKKFDKIWTCESDGFLLLPRASFGKPIVWNGIVRVTKDMRYLIRMPGSYMF